MINVAVAKPTREYLSGKGKSGVIDKISTILQGVGDSLVKDLRYVDFNGGQIRENIEKFTKLTIVTNSYAKGYEVEVYQGEKDKLDGHKFNNKIMFTPKGTGKIITSEEGLVVGEYFEEMNCIVYYFNVLDSFDKKLFKHLVERALCTVLGVDDISGAQEAAKKAEWDKQVKAFIEGSKNATKRELDRIKRLIRDADANVENYKQHIVNEIRKRETALLQEPALEEKMNNAEGLLEKELGLIKALDKVADVRLEDGRLKVDTTELYAYDKKDRRYHIGTMTIDIDVHTANVKFLKLGKNVKGENRGYWNDNDPHPHVNGGSGGACLGNASATIAELCSQYQIYPVVTICINFLENVNIDDSAGRRVRYWNMVDEKGKVIKKGGTYEV